VRTSLRAVAAVLVLVAGCAGSRATPPRPADGTLSPELMGEARDLYAHDCAPCHGADGKGTGPASKALRIPPADLTGMAARHDGVFPHDRFIAMVSGEVDVPAHAREMPVWQRRYDGTAPEAVAAVYAQRRLDLLAAYVESLQRR
jgi:mono/diheme cytochrome c family protein